MSHYIIGLTGGIASGKSALEREFIARGIFVADADRIARKVVEPGQPALAAVAAHFGPDILDAAGRLDRAGLRARIFHDEAARHALEALEQMVASGNTSALEHAITEASTLRANWHMTTHPKPPAR